MATATKAKPEQQPQWRQSLDAANAARHDKAALKRELRDGHLTLAQALRDPRVTANMTLEDLLRAQWEWGVQLARRTCRLVHLNPGKTVRSLTERQVTLLEEAAKPAEVRYRGGTGDPWKGRKTRTGRSRRICRACNGLFTSNKPKWLGVITLCDKCEEGRTNG